MFNAFKDPVSFKTFTYQLKNFIQENRQIEEDKRLEMVSLLDLADATVEDIFKIRKIIGKTLYGNTKAFDRTVVKNEELASRQASDAIMEESIRELAATLDRIEEEMAIGVHDGDFQNQILAVSQRSRSALFDAMVQRMDSFVDTLLGLLQKAKKLSDEIKNHELSEEILRLSSKLREFRDIQYNFNKAFLEYLNNR